MAAVVKEKSIPVQETKNYKGFVAGVFSGIAKLSGETTLPRVKTACFSLNQQPN